MNEKWGRFERVTLDAQCKFIPKVQKSKLRKQSPQWKNKAIRKSLRENNTLYKMYKKDRTVLRLKKKLRLAKRLFERHISEEAKCNPKRLFQYCWRKRKVNEEDNCIKNNEGKLLYKNKDIADCLKWLGRMCTKSVHLLLLKFSIIVRVYTAVKSILSESREAPLEQLRKPGTGD